MTTLLLLLTFLVSDVLLAVNPLPDVVPEVFTLSGVAPGADVVHVWAWPASGPVFLGYSSTNQPDPLRQFPLTGFSLLVQHAPIGTYPIVVYAHDPIANAFTVQQTVWVTVRPCTWTANDFQFVGVNGVPVFQMSLYCA